jgi:DNA-binding transcriptional regulator GbsR (MarR family)
MNEKLWSFIDAAGTWCAKAYGVPKMAGRVLGYLLVCDPAEQTAAQVAEALDASKGAISGATGWLVRTKLIERLHVRGERADRFRLRPEAWADQLRDEATMRETRTLLGQGLEALAGTPPTRPARLQELDAFYAWLERRMPTLWEEWQQHKQELEEGTGGGH